VGDLVGSYPNPTLRPPTEVTVQEQPFLPFILTIDCFETSLGGAINVLPVRVQSDDAWLRDRSGRVSCALSSSFAASAWAEIRQTHPDRSRVAQSRPPTAPQREDVSWSRGGGG
jgi:hypothetical protein